jgi:hypothetical protein
MPAQDGQNRFLGQPAGFSPNPGRPFEAANTSGSRLPPLFNFDPARLQVLFANGPATQVINTTRRAYQYYPDTPGTAVRLPYIYFSARQPYLPQPQPQLRVAGQTVSVTVRGYRPDLQVWPPSNKSGISEEVEGRMAQVRVRPYFRMTTDGKVTDWFNPNTCQIICGGLDGLYGAITADSGGGDPQNFPVPRVPIMDNMVGQGHYDNVTNFGVIESISP